MTLVLADSFAIGASGPTLRGLPEIGDAVIERRRLADRLWTGTRGILTVVEAPTGAGKTVGVADWAARSSSARGVLWLNAAAYARDVHSFSRHLRSGLLDLGAGPLPPLPSPRRADAQWSTWLIRLAEALDAQGDLWLVVLDDYPSGPCGWLGQQLARLLARKEGALRLVVTCTGSPALDVSGARLTGEYLHIGFDALRMDEREVVDMLMLEGLTPDPATVSAVLARTYGWAAGVDLAARALKSSSPESADAFDLAVDDRIDRDVLSQFPGAGRELIMRTSVVNEVPAGLARAVLDSDVRMPDTLVGDRKGFVDVGLDGSFRCHPLLRRTALRRLERDWPALAREARRAAAGWHLGHGDRSVGLALLVHLEDWTGVGLALVRSLAVPSIVIGATDGIATGVVDRNDVGAVEPLIRAAVAVSRGTLPSAEAALARVEGNTSMAGESEPCRRLSAAVVRMAMDRQRCDHEVGLRRVAECRQLAAELDQRVVAGSGLDGVLDAHESAFLLWSGEVDQAIAFLEPAAPLAAGSAVEEVTAADRVGQLAWVEALRGNLTSAARHAAMVLTSRPADGAEVGVGYAQLAAAWVHLERGELVQASQRLAHATDLDERIREPWLATAQRLVEARIATADGDPDAALRLLVAAQRTPPAGRSGWLADRLTVAVAEAHLAAADPQRALTALTPEPKRTAIEARVLAAAARRAIGDKRGAQALLRAMAGDVAEAPLPTAVQYWSLEAQLAVGAGDGERARALVARALRAASREQLRSALQLVMPWMLTFVDRNLDLSRSYRSFVSSLITSGPADRGDETAETPQALLEPLTERELQVLERLAQLRTTEEIAADLFVSSNTVKTHIKSLFLKMSVNRRADAVRLGRGLALC